ncbi:hypothetical protein J3R30DRAFT_3813504 [Lentinula aciculospora]|uniref:Uncharacterized protein n=1 Tax=Lentinula aciculospora TaxID=153920 RepID=A0A9W9AMX6_9AGAR|nr:hypothetical protein J3R30DRAFT_3813504 [Lentinula aciculospora]
MSSRFTWDAPGLNKGQFIALTNLLSLRNGRQLQPPSEQASEFGNDFPQSNPRVKQRTDSSPEDDLKQRFLDRLAEVISKDKRVEYVACTTMKEYQDHVKVWVACNDGLDENDKAFLCSFSAKMSALAIIQQNSLWNLLLKHNTPRLGVYASWVSSKDHQLSLNTICDENMKKTLNDFLDTIEHRSSTNKFDRLCCLALQIRDIPSAQKMIQDYLKNGKCLWKSIIFLARFRRAYLTFCEIAQTIPRFCSLEFFPIPKIITPCKPPPLKLADTFHLLRQPLNTTTVHRFVARISIQDAQQRFDQRQKQSLHVHAELQIVQHLLQSHIHIEDIFQYMGCSKRNCFMCKTFLHIFCHVGTRGCHGKLYNQWSIPEISGIDDQMMQELEKTVKQILEILLQELSKPIPTCGAVPDSSAGTTTIHTPMGSDITPDWDRQILNALHTYFASQWRIDWSQRLAVSATLAQPYLSVITAKGEIYPV